MEGRKYEERYHVSGEWYVQKNSLSSGRVQGGSRLGRPPLLSVQQEQKLVDYAENATGFGKQQFFDMSLSTLESMMLHLRNEYNLSNGGVCSRNETEYRSKES